MHHHYKPASFHFTEPQLHKLAHGHKVRVKHSQVGGGKPHTIMLHPVQHDKVLRAHRAGKGVDLVISDGEWHHTHHSGAQGTGIWDDIKSGFNKYVKPVLSTVGDTVANSLSYTNPEMAGLIQGVRKGVKDLTGVGMEQEAKPLQKAHKGRKKAAHKGHGNGLYL